jgi:predicted  nucleic acid-binding Zn-ribbon protein
MSTTAPVLKGTPLATAAEVEDLQRQVSELREQIRAVQEQATRATRSAPARDWREAMERLQMSCASMSDEERALFEAAMAEAQAESRRITVDE